MRDRPETTVRVPVMAPVTVVVILANSSSSKLLRSHLPTGCSSDATRIVVPGTDSLLPPGGGGGETSDRINYSSVMHVVSSS